EAETTDVSAWGAHDTTPGFERSFVGRAMDFYRDAPPQPSRARREGAVAPAGSPPSVPVSLMIASLTS
ncbi:hypothetical protein DLE01_00605, partial [Streptomyces sp. FT05W]